MSKKVRSDIEWIFKIQSRSNYSKSRVVCCRIRLIPTIISKIKWVWSGLPLNQFYLCWLYVSLFPIKVRWSSILLIASCLLWASSISIFFTTSSIIFFSFQRFQGKLVECSPTQTPTQKLKNRFSTFSSQEISSKLVSLKMIFEALQSQAAWVKLFRFKNLESRFNCWVQTS